MPQASMVFDVVIAGAGIIGSSIAWRLAQRGLRVGLFDSRTMGGGSSWAGAGMLAPGGEAGDDRDFAQQLLSSLRAWPDFMRELSEESGESIDYVACGALDFAFSDDELAKLGRRAARNESFGVRVERLNVPEIRSIARDLPEGLAGAYHYPDDAIVDPRDVMRALRRVCDRCGVSVFEGCAVRMIDTGGNGVRVATDGGQVCAEAAVLSAGAWSGEIEIKGMPLPSSPDSYPVKGYLVVHELAAGTLGPIRRREGTYVLQRSSGRVLSGSTEERSGFDSSFSEDMAADLEKRAAALVPALRNRARVDAWIGFRPGTSAPRPAEGRCGDSALWVAYGHYRNGILLAPQTAENVSRGIIASLGRR
ncbi:MAG: glycine oxidase ThiO [Bryobacteraceae bacterium]|nr:glycine oxidase ThiO [Bryobacteraceae bacterium]